MPENERAREGKMGPQDRNRRAAARDDNDDEEEKRVSTFDKTKYRPTYFRDLTDTIRRRYVPTRRADTDAPRDR